jgi:hypothetical protein
MADIKTKPTSADVGQFLESIEDQRKRSDSLEILEMMKEVTGKEPVMWGEFIVGFDQYTVRDSIGNENVWPLIAFSPRKQNLTLYIMPAIDRYGDLLQKLGKHSTGKVCLYIKRLSDVDREVLRRIMEISYRDAQIEFMPKF